MTVFPNGVHPGWCDEIEQTYGACGSQQDHIHDKNMVDAHTTHYDSTAAYNNVDMYQDSCSNLQNRNTTLPYNGGCCLDLHTR